MSLQVQAYAKVNLTLDVVGRRPDGYHNLAMVMQPLALYDQVTLRSAERLALETDHADLAAAEGNLAYRAALLLAEAVGRPLGAHITITKRIPISAGLAGGSANAAAALLGLNQLYHLGLGPERLAGLALQLGSDVPFCLLNRTALAGRRGERLTLLPPAPALPVVLATPRVTWSGPKTATVFRHYRADLVERRPDQDAMIRALAAGDGLAIAQRMSNVLEPVAVSLHPVIGQLKEALLEAGALGASMSGAGPTVLAILPPDGAVRAQVVAAARRFTDLVVETELLR